MESHARLRGRRDASTLRWTIAVVVAAAIVSASAGPASAGTYQAVACQLGAQMPETAALDVDTGWRARGCTNGSTAIWLEPAYPPSGSAAQARIDAPPGLSFAGGSFVSATGSNPGFNADYRYRRASDGQLVDGPVIGSAAYTWSPAEAADELLLRLRCVSSKCLTDTSRGDSYFLAVQSLSFNVVDASPPAIGTLAGALTEGAAQRGAQGLVVPASDQGSGVAAATVKVNGQRFATTDAGCALAPDGRALRLAPCPQSPTQSLAIDTTQPPFVEGPNTVEVCVQDYAQETTQTSSWAGQSCTSTVEYVDNSCDVSGAPDAGDVDFRLRRRTVRFGKPARAVAKLTDADGKPIQGATVCLSERDRAAGAPELDIAEAETNKRGKARVKLPKGASRRVKLTYWRDGENVQIEAARLKVRARPNLRVLGKRHLSDRRRARFRVKLAGPYRGDRKVSVQALAPAGWLDFPGCTGKTDKKGVFRCSYRFREQRGSVKYKFRALVPRQPGYPYLQGRTGAKRLVVRD